jgi:glyoxylase-like metal-dependent hydrolase (beta-lactamase superfamily II)
MSVDEVASNLYHAGQGFGYGAFVDAGDHLIALGGYGGLKDRYEAYTKAHGMKPLRHLILTHHHSDHVAGAVEALELGATLVMPETARRNVNAAVGSDVPDETLMILTDEKTTLDGVDIHMISTPHVQNYALLYVPSSKAVFQEDLYNNNIKSRASRVSKAGLSLKTAIDRLGLNVEHILGAHSRKVEAWTDFAAQAETPVVGKCPSKRPICR